MSKTAKNIGIAQPREENPKKRVAKSTDSYFPNPATTMNSLFSFGTNTARKCQVYNLNSCVIKTKKDQQKYDQSVMEANVGQMDRLNRLKALNKSAENKTC